MTKGKCATCKKVLGKVALKNHLLKEHLVEVGGTAYFMLKVEGYHQKDYWLYIGVKEDATLKQLDQFLRDIWLECCGHLSSFHIGEECYDSEVKKGGGFFESNLDMKKYKMKQVAQVGSELMHEYDFGSTTVLKLTVVAKYQSTDQKETIVLLGRNEAIQYSCKKCSNDAEYVGYGEEGPMALCEECVEEWEEEEAYGDVLPITNSPRMGVCAYEGESSDKYEI